MQKLHLDLNFPRENSPTIDDFEDDKIVLISPYQYSKKRSWQNRKE